MTNQELASKIEQMKKLQRELEQEYEERSNKALLKESFTYSDARTLSMNDESRASLRHMGTMLSFNVHITNE